MKREYSSGIDTNIDFFIGNEVENTIFKNQKTLFVVGIKTFDEIINRIFDCEHVYLGANKSFNPNWNYLNLIIKNLLKDFNVTLDVPHHYYEDVLSFIDKFILESDKFCLNLSVEIPKISTIKNLSIKIDDIDFKSTNKGIWCFSVSDIPKRCYNDWSVYTNDKILEK